MSETESVLDNLRLDAADSPTRRGLDKRTARYAQLGPPRYAQVRARLEGTIEAKMNVYSSTIWLHR